LDYKFTPSAFCAHAAIAAGQQQQQRHADMRMGEFITFEIVAVSFVDSKGNF